MIDDINSMIKSIFNGATHFVTTTCFILFLIICLFIVAYFKLNKKDLNPLLVPMGVCLIFISYLYGDPYLLTGDNFHIANYMPCYYDTQWDTHDSYYYQNPASAFMNNTGSVVGGLATSMADTLTNTFDAVSETVIDAVQNPNSNPNVMMTATPSSQTLQLIETNASGTDDNELVTTQVEPEIIPITTENFISMSF